MRSEITISYFEAKLKLTNHMTLKVYNKSNEKNLIWFWTIEFVGPNFAKYNVLGDRVLQFLASQEAIEVMFVPVSWSEEKKPLQTVTKTQFQITVL